MTERNPIYNNPALVGAKFDNLPGHAGVVPDGNDTWAKNHGLPMEMGHAMGAQALVTIAEDLRRIDELKAFSIWSISEQNIDRRSPEEIKNISELIARGLFDPHNIESFMETGTRFVHLGRRTRISPTLLDAIRQTEELTKENNRHILAMLIDYGGQYELETIIQQSRELALEDKRSARELAQRLPAYRALPPMDVLIRSKSKPGRVALSDLGPIVGEAFIYPLEKLWPDVTTEDVLTAFNDFSNSSRNFGGRK